ncbi:MAG: hypothetical protein IKP04_03695 [Candidatus Methanomethylophilaceae archaeon]|nr:hypothetical protein [Candidatus Methanomethylophilaceae archaeon]
MSKNTTAIATIVAVIIVLFVSFIAFGGSTNPTDNLDTDLETGSYFAISGEYTRSHTIVETVDEFIDDLYVSDEYILTDDVRAVSVNGERVNARVYVDDDDNPRIYAFTSDSGYILVERIVITDDEYYEDELLYISLDYNSPKEELELFVGAIGSWTDNSGWNKDYLILGLGDETVEYVLAEGTSLSEKNTITEVYDDDTYEYEIESKEGTNEPEVHYELTYKAEFLSDIDLTSWLEWFAEDAEVGSITYSYNATEKSSTKDTITTAFGERDVNRIVYDFEVVGIDGELIVFTAEGTYIFWASDSGIIYASIISYERNSNGDESYFEGTYTLNETNMFK